MPPKRRIDRLMDRQTLSAHPLAPLAERHLQALQTEKRLRPKTLLHYEFELDVLMRLLKSPTDTFAIKEHLRSLAAATVTRKLIVWRGFLEGCPAPWTNLLSEISRPKLRRLEPNFLTPEEVFLLEQVCLKSRQRVRDRLFVSLAIHLGLRLSEILNLKFSDLEQDEWLRVERKGGKVQRLPLSPSLQILLRQSKDEQMAGSNDWIFPGTPKLGQVPPMTARAAQVFLKNLGERAGLKKKLTPHALRHTFATQLASTGVNLAALKEIMGHERITTTERYLHITPTHLKEALGLKRTHQRSHEPEF